MHFLIYNMKRAINIIGTEQLLGILKGNFPNNSI
jgi:hypothetical protein